MKTLGGILLAICILIAGLSGLCSLVVLVNEAGSGYNNMSEAVMIVMMFGGIPFVIGIGLIFLGRHLIKSAGTV